VQRAKGHGLEDQHVERALQQVGGLGHVLS
jgi:hypothetical protein